MHRYVLDLREIDQTRIAIVGGKGAHLGELSRIEGIRVPPGFCVTTDAFQQTVAQVPRVVERIDRLSNVAPDDHEAIRALSADIRSIIEKSRIPDDLETAILDSLTRLGERASLAIRSSATAEDLPRASFAGQHDSFIDITGPDATLRHIRKCWASLFSERAVTYRLRNGMDHRMVRMAVVVQQMVFPRASGILLTADPVTGNRKVIFIEATRGLGEALVSGMVNADVYTVRDGEVLMRTLRTTAPALTDADLLRLAKLGRQIERRFGCPQDIEWCLADDEFQIVQSRPITTLFPIPKADDDENRVYLSVGHQQMMTDAMKPLGISFWQLSAAAPMHEAGGRLFVDATRALESPGRRAGLLDMIARSDPLSRDALQTILNRGFIRSMPDEPPVRPPSDLSFSPEIDPTVVSELIERSEESIAELKREIRTKTGPSLFDFILEDLQTLKDILFARASHLAIMEGMQATWWLNDHLERWLGDKNAADALARSVAGNVTSEMGLALLDVADVIRPNPRVVEFLRRARNDDFLNELPRLDGGREARDAIVRWLDKYGMRGAGEIDITRPRWSERPTMLVPILLNHIQNLEPGGAQRRFERGRQEAAEKEEELLARVRETPNGEQRAEEAEYKIDRLRAFIGYREYPKYGMVSRYFVYKQALMREAECLVRDGVLPDQEDVFYLTFQEFSNAVRTKHVDDQLIQMRKEAFKSYQALTPPRVLTSDGESITGTYRRNELPAGALVGLAVSAGRVEGRARVLLDFAAAEVRAGDILVTRFTDPSWTPLFVGVSGLITEIGGLMTHGAVIAREYGLPAVVGVENATRLIRDGQRIRLNATEGYVEILEA